MAEKKSYTVHRAMHGEGRDYARGDTRDLTPADAAPLLAIGALAERGKGPAEREPAVRHTFGAEKAASADYTTATGEGVVDGVSAAEQKAQTAPKVQSSAKKAG